MEAYSVDNRVGIKALLNSKNYILLVTANFISRFGDSLDSIAYGWMVYTLTGSKLLLGTIFAVNAIPNIILGPFAGVLADRLHKKTLIISGYLGRGLVVSLTATLFYFNILKPWHLFVFTIINSTLETMTMPAVASLLPLIISKEQYLSANSFSSSAYKLSELIGTGSAGVIIALIGISGAIFIDGLTFFIAAAIIVLLTVTNISANIKIDGIKGYLQDLKEGFSFVRSHRIIMLSLTLFAILNFCLAPINVLMPVYTNDIIKGGPEILSAMGISLCIGSIIGGVLVGQFGSRFKIQSLIIGGVFFFGLDYSILYLPGNILSIGMISTAVTCISFFLLGFLIPLMTSPIQANLMSKTERGMMGRVGALMSMISCCTIPLGSAFTGFICEFLSISFIFLIMGIIISLVAVFLLFNKTFMES